MARARCLLHPVTKKAAFLRVSTPATRSLSPTSWADGSRRGKLTKVTQQGRQSREPRSGPAPPTVGEAGGRQEPARTDRCRANCLFKSKTMEPGTLGKSTTLSTQTEHGHRACPLLLPHVVGHGEALHAERQGVRLSRGCHGAGSLFPDAVFTPRRSQNAQRVQTLPHPFVAV